MVNKKLTTEDEEMIYQEWLTGKPLSFIAGKYPVVISTVQRVIKKKSRQDGTKRNYIISIIFKHLKNANDPLELAIKTFKNELNEVVHEKQKEFLLESLHKLSENIETLNKHVKNIKM